MQKSTKTLAKSDLKWLTNCKKKHLAAWLRLDLEELTNPVFEFREAVGAGSKGRRGKGESVNASAPLNFWIRHCYNATDYKNRYLNFSLLYLVSLPIFKIFTLYKFLKIQENI